MAATSTTTFSLSTAIRKGQKLTYSAISTNQHLPLFGGARAEFGETIMGTGGTIEITIGLGRGALASPCGTTSRGRRW